MKFLDPLDQGLTVFPFLLIVEKYFDARLAASFCFFGGGVSTSKGSSPVILALPLFANEADLIFLVVILAIVGVRKYGRVEGVSASRTADRPRILQTDRG